MIHIFVPGEPVAKARPKARVMHGKGGKSMARMYTPKKTVNYENSIADMAKKQMIMRHATRSPVALDLALFFSIPESWPKWKREAALKQHIAHTVKPDADNVVKAIKDALNNVVYHDDAQVTEIRVVKLYSDTPGVLIDVTELLTKPAQITRKDQLMLPEDQKAA